MKLVNIYIQQLIEEALENTEDGVNVNGLLVKAVRFADDQAMVSSSNCWAPKDNRCTERNIKRLN